MTTSSHIPSLSQFQFHESCGGLLKISDIESVCRNGRTRLLLYSSLNPFDSSCSDRGQPRLYDKFLPTSRWSEPTKH